MFEKIIKNFCKINKIKIHLKCIEFKLFFHVACVFQIKAVENFLENDKWYQKQHMTLETLKGNVSELREKRRENSISNALFAVLQLFYNFQTFQKPTISSYL